MNRLFKTSTALAMALTVMGSPAFADMDAARAFLDEHIGDMSALTREEQEAELQWFIEAAEPFRGMTINVVSETITTHEWEASVLAPAFSEMTGINFTHTLISEGDVVERLQTQMQTGEKRVRPVYQRCRPDRHPLALPADPQPDRLDGRRWRGLHQPRP